MTKPSEYTRKVFQVWCRYESARYRLMEWHKARPFLKLGEGAYGRRLVLEMIDAHEKMLHLGASKDKEYLKFLLGLLNNGPPPYSPINSGSVTTGPLFLSRGKIYTYEYGKL